MFFIAEQGDDIDDLFWGMRIAPHEDGPAHKTALGLCNVTVYDLERG